MGKYNLVQYKDTKFQPNRVFHISYNLPADKYVQLSNLISSNHDKNISLKICAFGMNSFSKNITHGRTISMMYAMNSKHV